MGYVSPNDSPWPSATLGSLADITVGFVGSMASEYVPKGVPFLRSLNVRPFRIDTTDLVFIPPAFDARLSKSALKPGDVVVVRTGTPGIAAVIPEWLPRANCADLVVIRPGPALDSRFLAYYINGAAQGHVDAHLVGAVQQHYNIGSAKKMLVALPSLDEQRAISQVLGALDDKIDLNGRTSQTLEQMASALFRSWFIDFDPVVAKAAGRLPTGLDAETAALFPSRFIDSPIGAIPAGWAPSTVSREIELNPKRVLPKGSVAPYLEMANVPTIGHSPSVWEHRAAGSGMRFINGDALLARITPCLENGKAAYVDFLCDGEVGWGSTEYIVMRTGPRLPLVFAYLLIRDDDFRRDAMQGMTGSSGRQRVSAEHVGRYPVCVPDKKVSDAFSHIVNPWFAAAHALTTECRTLSALRDGLLRQFLSGEVRLQDVERRAGEAA